MVNWVPIIAIGAVVAFFGGFLCGPLKLCPGGNGGGTPLVNTQLGNQLGIKASASGGGKVGVGNVAYAYPAHVTVA